MSTIRDRAADVAAGILAALPATGSPADDRAREALERLSSS